MGENIGAAARAMGNFGLSDLRLAAPRDGWPNPQAEAMAAGSPVLDSAKVFETTAEAMADLTLVFAATARPRGMEKRVLTPRAAMAELRAAAASGEKTGILFGAERQGLENEDVASADAILTFPVDPAFRSLNLGVSVALAAYEWRAGEDAPGAFRELSPAAPKQEMLRLFEHFETELDAAGFFFPPEKTPLMVHNLRTALGRARFTEQEARTFRGAIKALAHGRGRRGKKDGQR
ncbi:MAG: RNA methyltransferase [Maricaulaceae bacterium]|nr:RNA methyltransferase [Maricaulaceae bacterium]